MPPLQPTLSIRTRHCFLHALPRLAFAALLVGTAVACVGSAIASSRSQTDPANPGAPEVAMASAVSLASRVDAGRGASATAAGVDAAVIYTCPMHPQVRSPVPGKCPICGMTLVPVQP
jgi:hypothetical protein